MDAAMIDKVGHEVGRLSQADHILAWDRKQARDLVLREEDTETGEVRYQTVPNPDARRCRHDPKHGILGVHGNGAQLVCCVSVKANLPCGYTEPISR